MELFRWESSNVGVVKGGSCPWCSCLRWELSAVGDVRSGICPRWDLYKVGFVYDESRSVTGWEFSGGRFLTARVKERNFSQLCNASHLLVITLCRKVMKYIHIHIHKLFIYIYILIKYIHNILLNSKKHLDF